MSDPNWYSPEQKCSYCMGDIDADERFETGFVGEVFHPYCAELVEMYRTGQAKKYLPPKPGWYDAEYVEDKGAPHGRIYVGHIERHVERDIVPDRYSPLDGIGFSWTYGVGDTYEWVDMEETVRSKMSWKPAPGPRCQDCDKDIPVEGIGDQEWGMETCWKCRLVNGRRLMSS